LDGGIGLAACKAIHIAKTNPMTAKTGKTYFLTITTPENKDSGRAYTAVTTGSDARSFAGSRCKLQGARKSKKENSLIGHLKTMHLVP
jgi:hypothetical protein